MQRPIHAAITNRQASFQVGLMGPVPAMGKSSTGRIKKTVKLVFFSRALVPVHNQALRGARASF
jgi:hypothetical protein